MQFTKKQRLISFISIALICVSVLVAPRDRDNVLRVHLLDVGQGDAIFIETPHGNQILVDAGGGKAVLRALGDVMGLYDHTIDLAVVTNPDLDHYGGFIDVLSVYTVGALLESGKRGDGATYEVFARAVERAGLVPIVARRGRTITLDEQVTLTILAPGSDVRAVDDNSGSIVALLAYASSTMLLTGDTTKEVEVQLVQQYRDMLDVDVLKVAHHGSKSSSSEDFLKAVSPEIALISAGQNNRYGHPHQEVLQRLKNVDAQVHGTYEEGTITFISNGKTWSQMKK